MSKDFNQTTVARKPGTHQIQGGWCATSENGMPTKTRDMKEPGYPDNVSINQMGYDVELRRDLES
jgi:hypothetical protein